MIKKEVFICASIYATDLNEVADVLAATFTAGIYKRIEQNTVLLYDEPDFELAVDDHDHCFFMTARYYDTLEAGAIVAIRIVDSFRKRKIAISLDYQEEDSSGQPTSTEINITYRKSE
jgi:hypothetical protein